MKLTVRPFVLISQDDEKKNCETHWRTGRGEQIDSKESQMGGKTPTGRMCHRRKEEKERERESSCVNVCEYKREIAKEWLCALI